MTDATEKMRLIRNRVDAGKPMSMIAAELGEDVDELCAWIMAYKEPRRDRYVNRMSPAQVVSLPKAVERDWNEQVAKFRAWKRQHDGAVRTREGNAA